MKTARSSPLKGPAKAPTGIAGLDEITGGGLPRSRTTLLVGGPGSGKTILALQFLVHGAQHCNEPGIFVAFEESSKRIVANAESFGWNLPKLRPKKLCRTHLLDRHEIEIVDVFREPKRALADGIFMTPTLVKLAPSPAPRRIVGTLSQTQPVLQALGLEAVAA